MFLLQNEQIGNIYFGIQKIYIPASVQTGFFQFLIIEQGAVKLVFIMKNFCPFLEQGDPLEGSVIWPGKAIHRKE